MLTRARKESAFHLALLVLVQWISLAVVILNATALFLLKGSEHSGLVNTFSSPADYMLIILGSLSFVGSSILLLAHLHIHFRIFDDSPFVPPKGLSASEIIISVISLALWTVATSLILTRSQEAISPCKFTHSLYMLDHSTICELFDTTLMLGSTNLEVKNQGVTFLLNSKCTLLAFAAVGSWVLVLLATLFTLIRSPIPPTTIFTIEAPPQRFSQPMNVSLPDEIYSQSQQDLATRPYYLGHHHNKVRPLDDSDSPHLLVTTNQPIKEMVDTPERDSFRLSDGRQTILMLQDHQQDNTTRHSYYQPQYNMALSSITSFNNTTATEESSSSSYYSSRMPIAESQRTLKSLSTIDSIGSTAHRPVQFDLPVIKLGHISHMDTSFLEKIYKRE